MNVGQAQDAAARLEVGANEAGEAGARVTGHPNTTVGLAPFDVLLPTVNDPPGVVEPRRLVRLHRLTAFG